MDFRLDGCPLLMAVREFGSDIRKVANIPIDIADLDADAVQTIGPEFSFGTNVAKPCGFFLEFRQAPFLEIDFVAPFVQQDLQPIKLGFDTAMPPFFEKLPIEHRAKDHPGHKPEEP